VLVATLVAPAAPALAETTTRLVGASNVEAAIAYSAATYADGAAPVVLLARDDDFADALTSGSAQGVLDAPLLLTAPNVLSPQTAAELERLDPDEVRIMGGNQAVSPAVETALQGLGYTTSRYFGSDRVGTAVAVAEALGEGEVASLLAATLEEEKQTDLKLTELTRSVLLGQVMGGEAANDTKGGSKRKAS